MARSKGHLSIGALARLAGVSVQTLRHYDALGLLHPATVTSAGYRLYGEEERVRLELVRSLRALDFDLETIAKLLRGALTVRDAAALHLKALDLQARTLGRRRAVLRVLIQEDMKVTPERLSRLNALAALDRDERRAFLGEHLQRRLRGMKAPPPLRDGILDTALNALPESPTDAQVHAWLELAEIVSDPTFLRRFRAGGQAREAANTGESAEAWRRRLCSVFAPAAALARAGADTSSPAARRVLRKWIRSEALRSGSSSAWPYAQHLLARFDAGYDPREARFWELLGVLRPEIARSPISVGMPWLVRALREHVAALGSAARG